MKISDKARERERTRLLEVANEYKKKGYEVTIEPSISQRPEFLYGFQPDLIVISVNDKVIVEVKTTSSLQQMEYLKSLAQKVEEQKEWRLEFVLTNPREDQIISDEWSIIPISKLQGRLNQANSLFKRKQTEGAILLLWVTLEAALQHLANQEKTHISNSYSKLLVKQLFSLGILDVNEYEILNQAADLRNKIFHGYTAGMTLDQEYLKTEEAARQIIERIIRRIE